MALSMILLFLMVTTIMVPHSKKLAGRQELIIMICIISLSGVENYSLLVIAQSGFTSLACGASSNFSSENGIFWIPDDAFAPPGSQTVSLNTSTAPPFSVPPLHSLRFFPPDKDRSPAAGRNCYSLPIPPGLNLVRSTFYYGNYNGARLAPMFGVSLGATLYSTVNLALKDPWVEEIIYNATDSRTFCLVAMVEAPVISLLELRPLPSGSYHRADPSYGGTMLRKVYRINCGSRPSESVRYPQDVSDRIWDPDQFYHPPGLTSTSAGTMSLKTSDVFDSAPVLVLTTDRFNFVNQSLLYALPLVADHVQLSGGFYLMNALFAELNNEIGPSFSISVNGVLLLSAFPLTPLVAFEFTVLQAAGLWWNLSLGQVHGSPQINGLELLQLVTVHTPAFQDDVKALDMIALGYNLQELQLDWVLGSDPCWPVPWMGVTCSDSGMVTSLDLSNLGLSGSIQSTFSDLANLQILNLSYNNLRGEIPDFSHLQNLQTLDLRNNMLSGTLDQLTGLSNLQFLYVMNNQLSGPIPNVFHRSDFFINTSGNTCIGYGLGSCPVVSPRPSPSSSTVGSTVGSSAGGGSSSSSSIISTSNIVNKSARNFSLASILGGGISALLMVLALLAVILLGVHHRRKTLELIAASKEVDTKSADTDVRHRNAKQFSLKELDLATNHFKDLLGQGRFGPVYHGRLADGNQVAIKVKCVASNHGAESFANEVISLSRVRHQNLVRLLGFCYESKKQLLVYEFMPGGTLMDHLYGSTQQLHPLSWKERLLIAIGAAAGIEHLHYVSNPKIIHGDIKSSNILLGPQNITKVSDFGLSRLLAEGGKARPQTSVKGTAGYLDPEYFDTQQLTEKSDVFSFGVVLLEILCGREPLSSNYPPEAYNLLAWVRPVLQKGIQNGDYSMLDKTIENQFNPKSLEIVASIAVQCTEREGANRPTMLEVVKELRHSIINQEVFSTIEAHEAPTEASSASVFKTQEVHAYFQGPSPSKVNSLVVSKVHLLECQALGK